MIVMRYGSDGLMVGAIYILCFSWLWMYML